MNNEHTAAIQDESAKSSRSEQASPKHGGDDSVSSSPCGYLLSERVLSVRAFAAYDAVMDAVMDACVVLDHSYAVVLLVLPAAPIVQQETFGVEGVHVTAAAALAVMCEQQCKPLRKQTGKIKSKNCPDLM